MYAKNLWILLRRLKDTSKKYALASVFGPFGIEAYFESSELFLGIRFHCQIIELCS